MNRLSFSIILTLIIISFSAFSALPARAALVGNTTQATLSASPQTGTYNVNDNFSVSIYVNTAGQNVVVVAAYLNYDKTHFQAVSIDGSGSVFTMEAEKIIDSANGVIKITRGIPAPGVNTANGLVATINFVATAATTPGSDNLTFQFSPGSTIESNVIINDGLGTDYLSGVYNVKYTVSGGTSDTEAPTTPTNLVATAISSTQINLSWSASTDNVGVVGYHIYRNSAEIATTPSTSYSDNGLLPSTTYTYAVSAYDAAGNNSAASSPKTATTLAQANSCTFFIYSDWSVCQDNNTQTRKVIFASPSGCTGGNPVLLRSCDYTHSGNFCGRFTWPGVKSRGDIDTKFWFGQIKRVMRVFTLGFNR